MSSVKLDINQTTDMLFSMTGEYVWFVRCDEDRILRLDFGEPHLTVREPRPVSHGSEAFRAALGRRVVVPTGGWHLFVENGLWSVEVGNLRCGRADQDNAGIDACLRQLDGQKLVSVGFDRDTNMWLFAFDMSGALHIAESGEGDEWVIFFATGGHLTCRTSQDIRLERP